MSLNRYVYARDNPMRYSDPTGHFFMVGYYNPTGTYTGLATGAGIATTTTGTTIATTSPHTVTMSFTSGMGYKMGEITQIGTQRATSTTTIKDTPGASPDVRLTAGGTDQYATGPTIGTNPLITQNQVDAWLVTVALGTSAIDLGLTTVGLGVGTIPSFSATASLAFVTGTSATALRGNRRDCDL